MAEIGIVVFTQIASALAKMPPYRSRFSILLFTHPQDLAILCLMRYADWIFGATEVHLV